MLDAVELAGDTGGISMRGRLGGRESRRFYEVVEYKGCGDERLFV